VSSNSKIDTENLIKEALKELRWIKLLYMLNM
jgi:hypothetical protein